MNINPNGVMPDIADASLVISTVIVNSGTATLGLGYGDIAGVVQHTQKDGWAGGHNAYDWNTTDWGGPYNTLRDAKELLRKAELSGNDYYAGVAKIFLAYIFGMVTDLWGDAPFWGNAPVSQALQGMEGLKKPEYERQKDIYLGILDYLEEANDLLSKDQNVYVVNTVQDILYAGNVAKWRKFANSLALRYYLRISSKEPAVAENGIRKILGNPGKYPLILDANDDAAFEYPGTNSDTSWPNNLVYNSDLTVFNRIKMCSTLVEIQRALGDPRLAVWANKVTIPLVLDNDRPDNFDQIIDGERVIGKGVEAKFLNDFKNSETGEVTPLCYNKDYVGYPPSWNGAAYPYNLNPNLAQGPFNPHASHLSDLYQKSYDPLLKARMLSAAEMHFSLAEIALKGWGDNAEGHYYAGIKASFETWGVSDDYDDYISTPGVVYNGTLAQIMEQKWIASWTAATEAWFDYRRTGLPAFKPGRVAKQPALPLRFYYGDNELNYNTENVKNAIETGLERTNYYSEEEGLNTAWAKMWLLQGTGKPW